MVWTKCLWCLDTAKKVCIEVYKEEIRDIKKELDDIDNSLVGVICCDIDNKFDEARSANLRLNQ